MLDIKFIRENADIVKMAATKKKIKVDIDRLLALDDERRLRMTSLETKKAEQNKVSSEIQSADDSRRATLIASMQALKAEIQSEEESLKPVMEEWQALMLQVPNIPDMTVPDGDSDADNVEIRTWGEQTKFNFEPKDHIEIMLAHRMVDFERGAKVHGFRGYYLLGDGARLMWAIWNYANDFFTQRDFVQMIPPTIVRKQNLYGTGHLPNDADDVFRTQDDDYLIGTSEVPGMGFYADEVLDLDQLPVKFLAFSPCYRREAGSHSKDVKGLIRVHEFYKVEQIVICEASHEVSVNWHEEITKNTEDFMQSLGIPYHVVLNCGADIGQGQVKKYDIEAWVPKEGTYRETHSASYFHDFQTRRFNIRYRDAEGKVRYAHSLNNTAVAAPRILVSLVENFQQADGSILIPEVLRPYMGKEKIG
ncbi:serine--tRNA ligase [Candidatus Kaiserbacteria bacterium RIFCSPLOWO2_02_FULL_45_11b]|uniref:Serine--tRNA ligase n=1 Tax=Candidatus Kaiserbacteria bacterium RIFCSPLOWO2_12_FULL_45_26 TaxID=1798525 RepID=A0A1F6FGE0_9BACT|nr:MAG: serine--tRNA ligase [Candidatus Kaiserbacteria bacterium RIFCSPHIGHO2_12_45_16]OGG70898.1 MAG: serine--tRNA ligase [Candidatus Kaiserbacteria bacterium RIFCSPLOWO2_01_FULL_45_25]OGG84229.1 MAG: serine--tRNA ligase [Candidatus Kaiserbacteria bacterium RIFCSPLOWO2_02_FULL_45_11b]OGG84918.1 MAG: serine--tRNA ligase [Candidatus Kaiserbacteria bacterium RIFCSPLOWO2_12_FULL_45_26]